MENIPLPTILTAGEESAHSATIVIEPLYPGYGATVGNALRRVLLSSLPGAAVTAVKIKGVDHEFSALDHVKEDVVQIILNLKKLNFCLHGTEPVTATITINGAKKVTGKDIKTPTQAVLVNPDQPVATLTDKAANLEMELTIEAGRGYVPVETRERESLPIGTIAIDAIFTPVRNVNFETEHVRVGQFTNYDRLKMTITTDGSVSPAEALTQAATVLVDHFRTIQETFGRTAAAVSSVTETRSVKETKAKETADTVAAKEKKEAKKKTVK